MNEFVYNTLHYFETLYVINQKLIKLCGSDAIRNVEESFNIVVDICDKIPRIFPYLTDKATNKLCLSSQDGILSFKKDIDFIQDEFQQILVNNYNTLNNIKKIRNNVEHGMHLIKFDGNSSGSSIDYEIVISIKNLKLKFNTSELIVLIKEINAVYSKIVSLINKISIKDKLVDNFYMKYLYTFDYKDFNRIYDDPNLKIIGKLQYSFQSNRL